MTDGASQSSFAYDPSFLAAMMKLLPRMPVVDPMTPVSVESLRDGLLQTVALYAELVETRDDVSFKRFSLARPDGSPLELRWYTKPDGNSSAAAVFVHGGGMIMGDLDVYDRIVAQYVGNSDTPILAVEYRLAPEHPHPAALDDVLTALRWLGEHAAELGVDPTRLALMGDSGGGGIAAGAALACRDQHIPLSAQLLIYPMLDDRNREADPRLVPFTTWTYANNAVSWDAVLGHSTTAVSSYAAAARATDLAGLPRTYLDVGELDIFCAEILDYAARLIRAGVSTEVHVHAGVPHAFEIAAPGIDISQRALADRYRFLRSI